LSASRPRIYYGWIIVPACTLIVAFIYGVQYSLGVFLDTLQEDFQWSSFMISWVPGLFMFFICVFGLFAGWFSDRYSPRVIVAVGGFFTGLGLVLTSYLTTPWHIFIYYSFIVGFGVGCCGPPIFSTVSRWIVEHRGLALGIVTAGIAIGTMIMSPLSGSLIDHYDDWRVPCRFIGYAAWVIVAAALLLRKQPETASGQADSEGVGTTLSVEPGAFTLRQALQTPALWLLIVLHTLAFTGLLMVMYHVVAYAKQTVMTEDVARAATLLTVISGASIGGRLAGGLLSDRIGRKPVFALCVLLQGVTMIWMARSASVGALYAAAALWGVGYGGWGPLMAALTAELFGLRYMGSILGVVSLSYGLGGVIGPAIAGSAHTEADSYSTAFLIGGVIMFAAAVIVPFLKRPRLSQAS